MKLLRRVDGNRVYWSKQGDIEAIGPWIVRERQVRRLSLRALGALVGLSHETIRLYEKGEMTPRQDIL